MIFKITETILSIRHWTMSTSYINYYTIHCSSKYIVKRKLSSQQKATCDI